MFLAPYLLLGLFAIGAPLWLHRVTRANPIQHPFASLMFIEAHETQRTARRTIRYWLLLALRIALLAALAFAFAGPLATEHIIPQPTASARLHAIVLDASFSMQHSDRWVRALDAAESVLGELRGADRVLLVRAAGRRIEVMHEAVTAANAGAVRAMLRELRPGPERLDFGLAMTTANNWLGSPRPSAVLRFASDLQRIVAPLRFADLEPPPDTQLVMHDVGEEGAPNAFIESAAFASSAERTLQAMVRSSATTPQERDIILLIDGREHARQHVVLPAAPSTQRSDDLTAESEGGGGQATSPPELASPPGGGTASAMSSVSASFSDIPLTPGPHRVELKLEPRDALPQDDQHFAVIQHADPKAMLISRSESADDAAYFEAALTSLISPRLTVERRAASAVNGDTLTGHSLAVIADANALSNAAAERVLEFVAAGGAVLATLGGDDERTELPLLEGWRIGEARTEVGKVGEISTTHPVLREANDWRRVRFFKQRSVTLADGDKVLIAYDNGAPLLVERTLGAGRMLVLTAPIDRAWNDLAIHPLFVDFVAECGRYLTGADASPVSYTAGSVVMTGLTAATGGQIFDPQGERVLSLADARAAERLVPRLTGFYEIRGGPVARWLAVNVDARESDLTPLPSTFVQRWQALRIRRTSSASGGQTSVDPARATSSERRSLGPILMWIAAALLLAELLLANRYLAVHRS
jgi:hypothetical protein